MTRAKRFVANLCVGLALSGALLPQLALANGEHKATRMRWVTTNAPEAPFGTVESAGSFKVNGQYGSGKGWIWREDLLQAPPKVSARVSLGDWGRATLEPGTTLRFSTVVGNAGRSALVVRLITGSAALTLGGETRAYLESAAGSFVASAGAKFRYGLREGRAFVDVVSGEVSDLGIWEVRPAPPVMLTAARLARQQAQAAPQSYRIKPVGGINNSAVFNVRARSTLQIQVQVTDENDRPVPDVPIIFTLGANIGKLSSATVATNAQGIATVNLTAANQAASSAFTASIQGTNVSLSGQIVVANPPPTFWTLQNAAPVLTTAAVAAAVAATVVATQEEPLQVQATGRPVVRP